MERIKEMQRVNLIIRHPLFIKHYNDIINFERNRIFCKHDIEHSLSVARIAWITLLSDYPNIDIKKDIVYAIGLLHDIGRGIQYLNGGKHTIYSTEIAQYILYDCHFDDTEALVICDTILHHHDGAGSLLNSIIHESDKKSRNCWICEAQKECKWKCFNEDIAS